MRKTVSIELRLPEFASYADRRRPALLRVKNSGGARTVRIRVWSAEGLAVPWEEETRLPAGSEAEKRAELFSPPFLAENDELRSCTVTAVACENGREICRTEKRVLALPFDWFAGLGGDPALLSAFVRPFHPLCAQVLAEGKKYLQKWGMGCEFTGYAGDKNAVKGQVAAIFSALKGKFYGEEKADLSAPLCASFGGEKGRTTSFRLALLAASCMERAGLNPVVALGGSSSGAGVWLHESCFLESVTDDCETVEKYLSEGVDELCLFDAADLFRGRAASLSSSQTRFGEELRAGKFGKFTDVRRCRAEGIPPCPLRERSEGGYRLLRGEEVSPEEPPAPLPKWKSGEGSAADGWERDLLDLSLGNALLNFTGKQALTLVCAEEDELFSALVRGKLRVKEGELLPLNGQRRELVLLERKRGIVRAAAEGERTGTVLRRLFRRDEEAGEETGARVLYLALGFLRYRTGEGKTVRAPVLLAPARLTPAAGGEFNLTVRGELCFNATLFEYLRREHGVRALPPDRASGGVRAALAYLRAETAEARGWSVEGGAALAAFSFRNYLLWNDIRENRALFGEHPLLSALQRGEGGHFPAEEGEPLLPLPCDGSQYGAAALAAGGGSFVLHGPPGTGKSQTIANMIASALAEGKKVLFVAEKRAAVEVVRKRLESCGLGDFCLLLHTAGDEASAAAQMRRTLSLPRAEPPARFAESMRELAHLSEEGEAPARALHAPTPYGFSAYDAILARFRYRSAPDLAEGEMLPSSAEKLARCREAIVRAAAAAREGGLAEPRFAAVRLSVCSEGARKRALSAAAVVLAEARHFKGIYALFLSEYGQRPAPLTEERFSALGRLAALLGRKFPFAGADGEEFARFYRANARADGLLAAYGARFRRIADPGDREALSRALSEGRREDRSVRAAMKKLSRAAVGPMGEEELFSSLGALLELHGALGALLACPLSRAFTGRDGYLLFGKRETCLAPLRALHAAGEEVFPDFDPDAFFAACVRNESALPIALLRASEGFSAAREELAQAIGATSLRVEGDLPDGICETARALLERADLLPARCAFVAAADELSSLGLSSLAEALERGEIEPAQLSAAFEKEIAKEFLERASADPVLSRCTVSAAAETRERYAALSRTCGELTREEIRARLSARLPDRTLCPAQHALLSRAGKGSAGVREIFRSAPDLAAAACPCLLMSPVSVAQYLPPERKYDLAIFDEASQMTSAEAAGSIARAKAAVIVGDPKQLPPTSFFRARGGETEDSASVLDDCLAAGLPERRLLWHYRSRHASLVAFSNAVFYDGALRAVSAPDGGSGVKLVRVGSAYDRGGSKRNRGEADALTEELVRRLRDPSLAAKSMGVVTFSEAQREEIERQLSEKIAKWGLEKEAYCREEPLFVKNLENVQGDERDVVFFSVCYGPDGDGKLSLNFGPLNRAGGARRLNVAITRAREETVVFTGLSSTQIDLGKTSSEGVAVFKAFLEYAERGALPLPFRAEERESAGAYLARELAKYGYECVPGENALPDVAVLGRRGKPLLGVLFESDREEPLRDRALRVSLLKRAGWELLFMSGMQLCLHPAREIARVKETLDRLSGGGKARVRYARAYRAVPVTASESASFVTGGEHDGELRARIREVVATEEPVSRAFLKKRVLATFGIAGGGGRVDEKMEELIAGCSLSSVRAMGTEYFFKRRASLSEGFRTEEGAPPRREGEDFTVFEMLSLLKGTLEERVSLREEEVPAVVRGVYPAASRSERFLGFLRDCVSYGEQKGVLVRSASDLISLA